MHQSSVSISVENELKSLASPVAAEHLSRFFKTKEGEYGYGDKFLGVKVPAVREIVKKYRREAELADVDRLTLSEWHEIRLAGFLLLIEIYRRNKCREIIDWYLCRLERGNNWDLVDVICPNVLGDWVVRNPLDAEVLYRLSESSDLWKQRVSIVSTLMLIRHNRYDVTLDLTLRFITHSHDLIHKAVGWTLREIGRKEVSVLTDFLDSYGRLLPRTTLRYAIERLPQTTRRYYLESTRR